MTLSVRQGRELFELLDVVRTNGGGLRVVSEWLHASAEPRAIAPILEAEAKRRGVELSCPLCIADAPPRRFTKAEARRLFGADASHAELVYHRRHKKRFRKRFKSDRRGRA